MKHPAPIRLSTYLVTVLAGMMIAVGPAAADGDIAAPVDGLHQALLDVMRDADNLGFDGRRDRLSPVVERSFDLPYISKLVMRRYWKSMDEGQRTRMVGTFTRLTVATYASRFDGYGGEVFSTISEKSLKRGKMLVRCEILKSDGDKVQLDYVLHEVDGKWRIVNVIADGVSDLALKRAEYASVMKAQGFDSLLGKLDEQIAGYEKDATQ